MDSSTQKVKPNIFSRFWTNFARHDTFSQSFQMKLKDGMDTLPTVSGLVFSILLSTMMILYTYQKFDVVINKKGD